MLKAVRFLMLGGIAAFAIALNAPGLRDAFLALWEPVSLYDAPPSLIGAILFAAGGLGYLCWLSGATLVGWKMPPLIHAPVMLFGAFLAIHGPVLNRAAPAVESQRDAGLQTLSEAAQVLERTSGTCADRVERARTELGRVVHTRGPRYRSHGVVRDGPVLLVASAMDLDPRSTPGSLQIECHPDRAELSFVVLDRLPTGSPTLLDDEVGRPFTQAVGLP